MNSYKQAIGGLMQAWNRQNCIYSGFVQFLFTVFASHAVASWFIKSRCSLLTRQRMSRRSTQPMAGSATMK